MSTLASGLVSQQVPTQPIHSQPLVTSEQTSPEQTKYLCSLYGLIANTPTAASPVSDANGATLSNLLSILSSLNDNPSDYNEDISHRSRREQQHYNSIYNPSSSMMDITKGERLLYQRQLKLKQINPTIAARTFTIVERVYVPTIPDRQFR